MVPPAFRNTFTTAMKLARCAALCHLCVTDGPERQLPQVRKFWRYEWLLLIAERSSTRL
jgi:hypothetical protein